MSSANTPVTDLDLPLTTLEIRPTDISEPKEGDQWVVNTPAVQATFKILFADQPEAGDELGIAGYFQNTGTSPACGEFTYGDDIEIGDTLEETINNTIAAIMADPIAQVFDFGDGHTGQVVESAVSNYPGENSITITVSSNGSGGAGTGVFVGTGGSLTYESAYTGVTGYTDLLSPPNIDNTRYSITDVVLVGPGNIYGPDNGSDETMKMKMKGASGIFSFTGTLDD